VQRGSNFINTSGGVSNQILNIAKSRVRGIELENTFRLSDALTVGLNYGYLDAKYLRYPGTVVNGAGQVVPLINSPYTGAPKHKVDLDVRYKLPMDENIGQVTAGANFSYQSKVYTNDTAIEDPLDESIRVGGILNLRLDWENVKGNPIDLSVFVRNVTNNTYIIGTAGLYNALGTVGAIYGDPRTFGVQARVRFGASANH
jgi:iron complex outermembrane receptor protein